MRWRLALTAALGAAISCLTGCRSCSKVERELAARESDVRTLKDELGRATFMADALSKELSAQKGLPGPDGILRPPTEPYPVRSLRLGGRTSGRPSDTLPGDNRLEVMLEPLDTEGQSIKAPGSAQIEVQEVTPEGLKRPLSVWEVPPDQLRRSWQSGLINTGYILEFPWKSFPTTETLRVTARFRMMDGRMFEADKDIRVRVLPIKDRPPTMAPPPMPPADLPIPKPADGPPILPAPKPEVKPPEKMPPANGGTPLPEGPTLTSGKGPAAVMLRPVPLKDE